MLIGHHTQLLKPWNQILYHLPCYYVTERNVACSNAETVNYLSQFSGYLTGVKEYYAFFKKKKKREKERNSLKYPLCVDCGTLGCLGTQFGNHKLRDCFYFAELTKCQRFQYLFNRHTHKHIHTQCWNLVTSIYILFPVKSTAISGHIFKDNTSITIPTLSI